MNNSDNQTLEQRFKYPIILVSIIIPVAVAVLFSVKLKNFGIEVEPLSFLPPIYAAINGLTALLLIMGVMAIRNGNRKVHERFMTAAIACSVIFLVMYVAYHMTADSTVYGDIDANGILDETEKVNAGSMRTVYLYILLSHIVLSVAIIPLVLITYVRALAARFDKHRRLAKITFPLWLYVAVTGVVVYLMISPYYAN
jgi:putative membrane protein